MSGTKNIWLLETGIKMAKKKERNITKDYMERLKRHIAMEFPEIVVESISMVDDGYGLYDKFTMEFKSPYIKLRESMEIQRLVKVN